MFFFRKLDVLLFQHQLKPSSFGTIYSCSETLSKGMHLEANDGFQNWVDRLLRIVAYSFAIEEGACF